MDTRDGKTSSRRDEEHIDRMLLDALGLGLHQTMQFLFLTAPTFPEFEAWVIKTVGRPDALQIDRLNAVVAGKSQPERVRQWLQSIDRTGPVLTQVDLSFWDENGYVVLRNAVSLDACSKVEEAIWQHVGADKDSPDSWYLPKSSGIMVELIQHPDLEANRRAARVHKAFAQLWGTADLWVTADRCGFHPPQRIDSPFPGPDLHWDLDFARPEVFGTQGILYLTETPPEQGALTLVPGFHHRLPNWLKTLKAGDDPQQQDLHGLGSVAIAGHAGDMVIWHHALPHGSRPNLGDRPRIVQYINMKPG